MFAPQTRDYVIRMPPDRWVKAACRDVGCPNWRRGFEVHADEATQLGQAQAAYIRLHSGRTFTERRTAAGITVFRFEPGQRCFAEHRTRAQRFGVRGVCEHVSLTDLAEDYTEHTGRLAEAAQKG